MVDAKRIKTISFFAALCLFLSAVEYAIPKPLPFMRVGLANLPVLLSLYVMSRRETLLLVICKVLGQAFLSGTLFSYIFLFSLAGSFASAGVMIILHQLFAQKNLISALGLCIAGAVSNNLAQLALSYALLFGESSRYIAPVLLISGLANGTVLGLFATRFIQKSRWFALLKDKP